MATDASARTRHAPSPLAHRIAVVTGASRGIGRALALELAASGARVVAAARSTDELRDLAQDASDAAGEVIPMQLDVADPASVERFAERVRERFAIDVLVNNAGVGAFAPVMEVQGDGVRVTEVRPGRVATYFGSGDPPPVGPEHLSPEDVADAIVYALERPDRMRLDEIHFHPVHQTAEF